MAQVLLGTDLEAALASLATEVSGFCEAESIDEAVAFRINLVLDELITNSISHALPGVAAPHLKLSMQRNEGEVFIVVEDNGPSYNPFDQGLDPDTDLMLDERPIGGLGVLLVKKMTQFRSYERSDGLNRIKLTMDLSGN